MNELEELNDVTLQRVKKISEDSLKRAIMKFIRDSSRDCDYYVCTFNDYEDYPGFKASKSISKTLEFLLLQAEVYDSQLQYARRR